MENLKPKEKEAVGLISKESLQARLMKLQEEWNKGQSLLQSLQSQTQSTQAQMLRIEGAMALIQEQLVPTDKLASSG
ncbi:MAG: hypothetical protein AAB091_01430 [Elusimicrobiota bacterium]